MLRLSNILFLLNLLHSLLGVERAYAQKHVRGNIVVKCETDNARASADWVNVLKSRNIQQPDSTLHFGKELTGADTKWLRLIESRRWVWESMIDSLAKPFDAISNSNVVVLAGTGGEDDAFTYGEDVIGLDLSVLSKSYGSAELPENKNRIDRLFAHEMTHLLHKGWMKKNNVNLLSFKDSVLWECIYEGLGTYRSLSDKWLPVGDSLPVMTSQAIERLCGKFVDNIAEIHANVDLGASRKNEIRKGLSRGRIDAKWGAFPVAVWIAIFTRGNADKLKTIIEKGTAAPLWLANHYLPADCKQRLNSIHVKK